MSSEPGGKGSAPRPFSVDSETYGDRFDAIFRKQDKDSGDSAGKDGAGSEDD